MKFTINSFLFKEGAFSSSPRNFCHPNRSQDIFLSFLLRVLEFNFYVYGYDPSPINFYIWDEIMVEIHIFYICLVSNFSTICWKYIPFAQWNPLDFYWKSIMFSSKLCIMFHHAFLFSCQCNIVLSTAVL